jgi:hypothetical protein
MELAPRLAWLFLAALACACATACVAAPPLDPEQGAPRIVALLDAQKTREADELFEAEAREAAFRDALYPLLYAEARGRFEHGAAPGAATILRFMMRQYPGSIAVREALVYALFLERAASPQAAPELVAELGAVLATLQHEDVTLPPYVELALVQQAIDRGEPAVARDALARFQRAGTDAPPEIVLYAEDLDRYLRSQPKVMP